MLTFWLGLARIRMQQSTTFDKLPPLNCVNVSMLALSRIRRYGKGITTARVTRIRNQRSMAIHKLLHLDCLDVYMLALSRIRSHGEGITTARVSRIRNLQSTAFDYYPIRTAPTNEHILSVTVPKPRTSSQSHFGHWSRIRSQQSTALDRLPRVAHP